LQIAGGMVYMAAIIDWHSKAVLSHRISNTMDSQLVIRVLVNSASLGSGKRGGRTIGGNSPI
jgi:putative transposase